ncbi:olfactory receptor 10A4-like [Chelonoidis abingdonii]|uniref:olfactory receptor 10A4-like n=1 Tax=Chelonoidis abingdonii TaxID=106734 RepID=UPI0013F26BB7|nr:olfactory receptor 10A4-like [Chelonoidis abingdonii]
MADTDWRNQTFSTEFILLGFGNLPQLQILLFLLFIVIYIVTMMGNILIIALVMADQYRHTPMYFFLGNLSCLEICCASTILPRMLDSSLTEDRTISVQVCIAQLDFFRSLVAVKCSLLSVMSYDRYLAICKPLQHAALLNGRLCFWLAAGSWVSGFGACTITECWISQIIFCGPNEIDHFFCDYNPLVKLSCSDTSLMALVTFLFSSILTQLPILLTLASYMRIIATIQRIPSTTGRQKAFSTVSSHLIVVTLYHGMLIFVYLLPDTKTLKDLHKVFSLFYTVLIPLVNPLIYSLRSKEVKEALRKAVSEIMNFRTNSKLFYM